MTKTMQYCSVASFNESEKDLIIRTGNKENKIKHIALIKKISGITIICVLLAFIVISIFSIHSMKTTSIKPAINIGTNKLKSDMVFFENRLSTEYGQLKLIDGELIGQEGVSLKNNYKLVDDISSNFDIAATVFARNDDDYLRISTSIVDNAGIGILFIGKDMTAIEKLINTNIVKYIIRMTAITFIIFLASVSLFGLGYKYKFFSHRVK
jgi:competence protein ComGF